MIFQTFPNSPKFNKKQYSLFREHIFRILSARENDFHGFTQQDIAFHLNCELIYF